MKIIKKIALFLSFITLGLAIVNCSSEESGEDTKKDEPKAADTPPIVIKPPVKKPTTEKDKPVTPKPKNFRIDKCESNPDACSEKEQVVIDGNTITIQAESIELNSDWKLRNCLEGFNGCGYIIWEGQRRDWKGLNNIGKVGKLSYKVKIANPGKYRFVWRSTIGKLDPTTPWGEHNDTWLKFPDATDSYALNGSIKHYPVGSGKTPNGIGGENGNGFFKIYMNNFKDWKKISVTWDNKDLPVFVEYDMAGEYTIEIAARSNFHAIDELILIKE